MNQRSPSASTAEFFNKIRQKRPFGTIAAAGDLDHSFHE
jgi:hypothetical protein